MTIGVIIAQVAGILGWLLLIYSYYKEDIDKLLYIQIISSIFYCLNYLFLGAYAGLIVCLFELIKEYLYYKTDLDDYIFLLTLPVYGLIAYYSYDGIFSLLPVIGSIIDGLTLAKNKNTAVVGGIISNILWVIYDCIILAYTCAITDGILVLSNLSLLLVGYSKIIKVNKFKIYRCKYLSNNIVDSINKLDYKNYGEEYLWDNDYQKNIFYKNKDSLILLKYKDKIIGYINYITITKDEYIKILDNSKVTKKYDLNNVTKFYKSKNNYIVIDSINVEKEYQNYKTIELIKEKIINLIKNKSRNGYKISGIISTSVNKFEEDVLEELQFKLYKKISDSNNIYELDSRNIKNIINSDKRK